MHAPRHAQRTARRTRRAPHAPRTRAAPQVVHTAENTYIVMELLSGGELFNRIVDKGCYPEKVRVRGSVSGSG